MKVEEIAEAVAKLPPDQLISISFLSFRIFPTVRQSRAALKALLESIDPPALSR
jgi:hypothetical protein